LLGFVRSVPAQTVYWENAPYRIHVTIALDLPGQWADLLAVNLPEHLQERTRTAIGPVWRLTTEVAEGPVRHAMLTELNALTVEQLGVPSAEFDKIVLLIVRKTASGFELTGREYDRYVDYWRPPVVLETGQAAALPEQLFSLLTLNVSPLAQYQLDPQNDGQVLLSFKGAALPTKNGESSQAEPGDVLLPFFRRTTRTGELLPDGIRIVPWTYLSVDEVSANEVRATVLSGTRRPFGARRRGRVEQVAMMIRGMESEVVLRLHSREDASKPLTGYEVFLDQYRDKAVESVGISDRQGEIRLTLPDRLVHMLYIKSGSIVLARTPVVASLGETVDVALPDEDSRLLAEARLAAMREDLIDVVARRRILVARVRDAIDVANWSQADRLLGELDALPGRAYFDQQLRREEQLVRADSQQTQRRIDRLFAETRAVLGKYLDSRSISELRDELNAKRREDSASDS
jgi:hypothetical protein